MKMKLTLLLLLGAVFSLVLPALAADLAGSKDTPFIKRYNGSEIVQYKAKNYDVLNFTEKDDLTKKAPVEGSMIRIGYRVPPSANASALEIYRNYLDELKSKGFQILNSGSFIDLKLDNNFIGDVTRDGGYIPGFYTGAIQNCYEISAVKKDPAGDIHLRVVAMEITGSQYGFLTSDIGILVDSLVVKGVVNKMVDGTADDMSKQIASTGPVNLYGIYFDTDKTEVKPESKPTLDEVGKLLTGDMTLKLKVVGHTDNTGAAVHNQELSLGRAKAVVASLVSGYGITADRLQPEGLAATKPIASNDTEEGRAKNRRVELVKL